MDPSPPEVEVVVSSSSSPPSRTMGHKLYLRFKKKNKSQTANDDPEQTVPADPNWFTYRTSENSQSPTPPPSTPSLDLAWHHFEYITLPRFFTSSNSSPPKKTKAKITNSVCRTNPTNLYPLLSTSLMDLNDFGLGVSLYFVTIAFLSVLLFISSCVAIPSLVYFSSTSYSASQSTLSNPLLRGSAICTTTAWVACPSCDPSLFPDSRKDSAGLFLKNNCAVDNDDTFR